MAQEYLRRRITISFTTFEVDIGVTDDQLTDQLNETLHDWEEGRYPFEVEMFRKGLEDSIKTAMSKAVGLRCREELGDQMIDGGEGQRWSAAFLKQCEVMREAYASVAIPDNRDEPSSIKVETTQDPK